MRKKVAIMADISVAAQLCIVLGVFFFSTSSSLPMSPPDMSAEDAVINERRWRSREAVEMPSFTSSMPSGVDKEEAAYPEKNVAESRSILTKLFSPFVGSHTRGNPRGSHKSREKGTLQGRRPVQGYQQVRFVSSAAPRFRPKGTRGRVPNPSLQQHIFQPISSSPVSIRFPTIGDTTSSQHFQNTNTLTYENSPFKNITNQNNVSNRYQPTNAGNKPKDIPRAREPSLFTVTPFTLSPSTNSILKPNHLYSSPHHISNSPSALIPNTHSSLLVHSSNQNRPFLAQVPSIRFSSNSQETPEIQDLEKSPGNSENSVIYKSQPKENSVDGFVSLQNVNDITSNINIDDQFLKSFGASQISFGPDNSFFLTGNLSEITSHKGSKEKQREIQTFSASHLTDQILSHPQPTKTPNLGIIHPITSQNTYTVSTTEPTFIFITGAPSPFEIEHLTSLPTTPTGISHISHQQQESPQLDLQAYQVPLSHFQTTSTPQVSYQQQITPSVQYQPLTTPKPLHDLQSTLAPIHQQLLLSLSPRPQYHTTSKQYHTEAKVTPHWNVLTTQPEYRTQPTELPIQVQTHQESLLTDQQKGSAPIINGSQDDKNLQAEHQNQQSYDVKAFQELSTDNNDGFIPFSNSNDFFNHIFGKENPFGDKIITTVPSNITPASVSSFNSNFNIAPEDNQQPFLSESVPFVNKPTQHETILSTASTANEPNTHIFTPAPVSITSQPLITQLFTTHETPTSGWPSTPFKSSASVFAESAEKDIEPAISQSPWVFSDGWSQQDSTTELQTQTNDQSNLLNTAIPLRTVEPFTVSEGGENPYTSSLGPVQLSNDAGPPHTSQTTANLKTKNDAPSTIMATTTIDNKEFEVLVLPYEKGVSHQEEEEQKDFPKSSSIALAPGSHSQKSFNPGLPLKATEEEVSVYLVRHRKPSNIIGGSPTPPTSTPPSKDNAASNGSTHLGLDALEFRGFPIPADFAPKDDGSHRLISSPSRLSGTAVSASGKLFKFEYNDDGQKGNVNFLPKSFKGFDTNGNNQGTGTKDASTQISSNGDVDIPFAEPHEYVQVLGLLAPPPGVICVHGICEDEEEYRRK
ncbi:mucin-12-like [Palaemon carinicauda]|uniref:mucin-12-like n=1 Tax=Palaemon carinicauda TaxID=392227 RepID=UPI0035B5A68E